MLCRYQVSRRKGPRIEKDQTESGRTAAVRRDESIEKRGCWGGCEAVTALVLWRGCGQMYPVSAGTCGAVVQLAAVPQRCYRRATAVLSCARRCSAVPQRHDPLLETDGRRLSLQW